MLDNFSNSRYVNNVGLQRVKLQTYAIVIVVVKLLWKLKTRNNATIVEVLGRNFKVWFSMRKKNTVSRVLVLICLTLLEK